MRDGRLIKSTTFLYQICTQTFETVMTFVSIAHRFNGGWKMVICVMGSTIFFLLMSQINSTQILQLKSITRKKRCKYKRFLDFLTLLYFNMLSTKKSAQTLVFIAFFPFMTIPTEKSGFKKIAFSIRRPLSAP